MYSTVRSRQNCAPPIEQAARSLAALMTDCDALVQAVMQWLGTTATPWIIDRDIEDLAANEVRGGDWLTYLRYNAVLEPSWLHRELGIEMSEEEAAAIRAMDDPSNVAALADLGSRAARRQVQAEQFPHSFDV